MWQITVWNIAHISVKDYNYVNDHISIFERWHIKVKKWHLCVKKYNCVTDDRSLCERWHILLQMMPQYDSFMLKITDHLLTDDRSLCDRWNISVNNDIS